MGGRRRSCQSEAAKINTISGNVAKDKNRTVKEQKMITYVQLEIKPGEELCVTTEPLSQIPEGLNVYDEGLKTWVIGIPWDECEEKWSEKHKNVIAKKPIVARDDTLRENETKYILKYKTVDKKVRPVAMTIPEELKVRRTFPRDPLASLPPLPLHAVELI